MLSYCKDPKFMIGKLIGMSQSSCWANGVNTEDRAGRLGHASASPPGSHPHSCHPHRLCGPELVSLLPTPDTQLSAREARLSTGPSQLRRPLKTLLQGSVC